MTPIVPRIVVGKPEKPFHSVNGMALFCAAACLFMLGFTHWSAPESDRHPDPDYLEISNDWVSIPLEDGDEAGDMRLPNLQASHQDENPD